MVALNEMKRMAAAPLAPSTPPMPPFAQTLAPSQTFTPPMTSTAASNVVLSHGQHHHVKPIPSWTQGAYEDYYGGELRETNYYG